MTGRPGEEPRRDLALRYLGLGWSVVPAVPRGKRAIVPWRSYQDHPPGEGDVRGWFDRWLDANIAINTGAGSGLVVLDVDPAHGGEESLAALEARHGPPPETIEAATGGGGRHIYFRHPGGEVRNRAAMAPGLDLRGDGGLVIAPPSIHPRGRPYRWRPGHGPGEASLTPMPKWLLSPRFAGDEERPGHSIAHWRDLVREGVAEGRRNTGVASFTGPSPATCSGTRWIRTSSWN